MEGYKTWHPPTCGTFFAPLYVEWVPVCGYVSTCLRIFNLLKKWEVCVLKTLWQLWASKELWFSFLPNLKSGQCPTRTLRMLPGNIMWVVQEVPLGIRSELSVLITEHRGSWTGSRMLWMILNLIKNHLHFIPNLKGGYAKGISERRVMVGRRSSWFPSLSSVHLNHIWGCQQTRENEMPSKAQKSRARGSQTFLHPARIPKGSGLC